MSTEFRQETLGEKKVNYTIEVNGKLYLIKNVPARVCLETGERFFAPETVERLQKTIWQNNQPQEVIQTLVFNFSDCDD